jgi:hypothetical protein
MNRLDTLDWHQMAAARMNRLHQFVLIAATLGAPWPAVQAVHELGHVLGAIGSCGKAAKLVLHPVTISYTRLAENPNPVFVRWMGPLIGVALPVVAVAVARSESLPGWCVVQFFSRLCLEADGAYLAFESFNPIGDAGDLLADGT